MSTKVYKLPDLFVKDKLGRTRVWRIKVVGNTTYKEYGLVNGKLILNNRSYEGKNIGKTNATTDEGQAKEQAFRDWVRKLTSGSYVDPEDVEGKKMADEALEENAKMGGQNRTVVAKIRGLKSVNMKVKSSHIVTNTNLDTIVTPMKAKVWEVDEQKQPLSRVAKHFEVETGFWIQPKLDGIRCLASSFEDKIILTSNGRKQFPWFEEMRKEIEALFSKGADYLDGLDGELCVRLEDMKGSTFADISRICSVAKSNPHPKENQIQLHVFDLVDKSGKVSQAERFEKLDKLFAGYEGKLLTQVETRHTKTYDDVEKWHNTWVEQGLEGIIMRGEKCHYQPSFGGAKRSLSLRKYKCFQDAEFEIIGAELDKGVDSEFFVWVVKMEDGQTFSTKPMGSREERREYYQKRKEHIGKLLKIRYQGVSKDDGRPRFPIGVGMRPKWDISKDAPR